MRDTAAHPFVTPRCAESVQSSRHMAHRVTPAGAGCDTYPDCSATLTAAELGLPFAMADADGEALARPFRLALEWEEDSFAEIDPATGGVVSVGQCAVSGARCAGEADA